jgi:hypothetical protein
MSMWQMAQPSPPGNLCFDRETTNGTQGNQN